MGLYARYILPRVLDLGLRDKDVERVRAEVVPAARGVVFEIGIGSGLNLKFYPPAVTRVFGVDTSTQLLRMARSRADGVRVPVALLNASALNVPLPDATADTAVVTWSLCTIPDPVAALREARRVLKRDGVLLFADHGLSDDPRLQLWQNRLTPVWRRLAGGCHLNRPIDAFIRAAGFTITALHTRHLPGPRFMTYTYIGSARPA